MDAIHTLAHKKTIVVYYYDSPPLDSTVKKPISNTPHVFKKSEAYSHQHTLFRELKQSDFISVREGVLAFRAGNQSGTKKWHTGSALQPESWNLE